MTLHRRRFLKQTGIAAGATLGVAASTASADGWSTGYVSTRGHFDCDGNHLEDPEAYDTHNVPAFDRAPEDELLIHIHGWKNKGEEDAQGAFDNAKTQLQNAGYDGEVIGWWWDSDCGWYTSKDIAWWNGLKVAQFIRDYRHLHGNDPTIRVMGHSLGVRVGLTIPYYFDEHGVTWEAVRSMHLLGGAAPHDWPDHENLEDGLEQAFGAVYNYYNEDDTILGWGAYKVAELGGRAVGKYGSENGGTCNFHDWDVTSWWGSGHDFTDYIQHCNDLVVTDMGRVDEYRDC